MLSENGLETILVEKMSRTGKGICESCHFVRNCTLYSSDEITWECSEYEPMVIFFQARSHFLNTQNHQDVSGTRTSLCGHCTLKNECCYYSPEIFIYNCENVQ